MQRIAHGTVVKSIQGAQGAVIKAFDGKEMTFERIYGLESPIGAGDEIRVRYRKSQGGTIVMTVCEEHQLKAELDAAAAARAAEEAERLRRKDVEARVSWYWDRPRRLTAAGKEFRQNVRCFGLNLSGGYGWKLLYVGDESLLRDLAGVLKEHESMTVMVTVDQGEYVPGSMRRV